MKKIFAFALLAFSIVTAFAAPSNDEVATIVSVKPVEGLQVQQQQVCDVQPLPAAGSHERGTGGSIIGGIAGALLGSQVGGGNGRIAAAAAGAIAGTVVGDRVENRQVAAGAMPQQVCRLVTVNVPRIIGYQVTYEFDGRTFQHMMNYDPSQGGNTALRVAVSVTPR